MPELHDLSPPPGSSRNRKRVGRGPGSGKGKTSGRGHKGQGSRSGGSLPAGFEGGQMPLQRRIPKRGFTNIRRVEPQVVNLRDLDRLEPGEVTPQDLLESGLISTLKRPVKILGTGEVEGAFRISAHGFSKTARAKIEEAGGAATVIGEGAGAAEPTGPVVAAPSDTVDEAVSDSQGEDETSEAEDEQA